MAALQVEPLHEEFGASVRGIDLRAPRDEAAKQELRDLVDRYSFLCFPEQDLDDESQLALTEDFGELEEDHYLWGLERKAEYFGIIGNVTPSGEKRGNDHVKTRYSNGNNLWHSDSSFREVPAMLTLTYAYEVPDERGETEFASERSAYGRLSQEMKDKIDPLQAIHDYVYSRSQVAPVSASHAASLPPVPQKMVRTNPGTGERNFYLGSHVKSVVGWSYDDSRILIDDLMAEATEPEHVYSHVWKVGDLVIWDNRCLLHRGRGYDADKYRRYMRQTRVRNGVSSLDE